MQTKIVLDELMVQAIRYAIKKMGGDVTVESMLSKARFYYKNQAEIPKAGIIVTGISHDPKMNIQPFDLETIEVKHLETVLGLTNGGLVCSLLYRISLLAESTSKVATKKKTLTRKPRAKKPTDTTVVKKSAVRKPRAKKIPA